MSATDELRKLLDERGVEYFKHEEGEPLRELHEGRDDATSWRIDGANVCAVPFDDSTFDLWIDHATPEQAIVTTLGVETCKLREIDALTQTLSMVDGCAWSECSECGCLTPDDSTYCINCGRKVEG